MKNTLEQKCLKHRIKLVLAWPSGSSVKTRNKRNRNNFIEVNGFVKKRKKLIFIVVEFILIIFKNENFIR